MIFILFSNLAFAEFQLGINMGYFFETNTYESETSRSFNGLKTNLAFRYFFNNNIGLFLGAGLNSWFTADNDEYIKDFTTYRIYNRKYQIWKQYLQGGYFY